MLSRILIEGIKAFGERTEVSCAPVTLLTGSNSCGKSTVLQSVLLAKQLADGPSRDAIVRLNGPLVSQGAYRDWSSGQIGDPLALELHFAGGVLGLESASIRVDLEAGGSAPGDARLQGIRWLAQRLLDGDKQSYQATLSVKSTDDFVRDLEAALNEGGAPSVGVLKDDQNYGEKHPYRLSAEFLTPGAEPRVAVGAASVSGLVPVDVRSSAGRRPHQQWLVEQWGDFGWQEAETLSERRVPELLARVRHLGPLRDEPKIVYAGVRARDLWDVGSRGEGAVSVLAEYGSEVIDAPLPTLERGSIGLPLAEAVADWAERIGVASSFDLDRSSKFGTEFRLAASYSAASRGRGEIQANLRNVGIGVSQVLPILVLCLSVPPGSTVLLEQPELHLHPAVQSRLGDFFAACALSGRQLVVETHSEHLINRVRLLVARRHLDPASDVAINFVERDALGAEVTRIGLDQSGQLDRWPRGFFDETQKALKDLMAERFS